MDTYEAAKAANFDPDGHPRIETTGIIPWKHSEALGLPKVPCTIESGPYKGVFVSQTSLLVNDGLAECDQARYVDSFTFNANRFLPRGAIWKSQGVATDDGDLVVVRDKASGRLAYAVNGDKGPANNLGRRLYPPRCRTRWKDA